MVLQHDQAGGAVTGGAVELAAAAVADVAGGVGNLPAVNEHGRILAPAHRGAVGQSEVIGWVSITETLGGCDGVHKDTDRNDLSQVKYYLLI